MIDTVTADLYFSFREQTGCDTNELGRRRALPPLGALRHNLHHPPTFTHNLHRVATFTEGEQGSNRHYQHPRSGVGHKDSLCGGCPGQRDCTAVVWCDDDAELCVFAVLTRHPPAV